MPKIKGRLTLTLLGLALMGCAGTQSTGDMGRAQFQATGGQDKVTCHAPDAGDSLLSAEFANEVRGKVGFPPVEADPRLSKAAAKVACALAKNGESPHSSFRQGRAAPQARASGYQAQYITKNIWAGGDQLPEVLEDMNRTPVHLKPILAPQVRHVGAGSALMSDGKTLIRTFLYAVEE